MVPYIAKRGHSFKGAGAYYLHDKEASSSERVSWTHTQNLPTDDPKKAIGWMAHTAMNAEQLKAQAGISRTGRKSSAGSVYSFSLAWHPEQNPNQEYMLACAQDAVELLGLSEHEVLYVAHNETDHDHVHCIVNLVHPENGKRARISYDRLTLSTWAEDREREEGQIYCEERVINNQKRREQGRDQGRDSAIIKHKEQKLKRAELIATLYQNSDSGKAFRSALKLNGYELAQGDKRGFVLVDAQGKIHSLSRQLKGQRAKDIRNRLSDLDKKELPQAKILSLEIKYQKAKESSSPGFERDKPAKEKLDFAQKLYSASASEYLKYLDDEKSLRDEAFREKHLAKQRLDDFYGSSRAELEKERKLIRFNLDQKSGAMGRFITNEKELSERLIIIEKELKQFDHQYEGQLKGATDKINEEYLQKLKGLRASYGLPVNDNRTRLFDRKPNHDRDERKKPRDYDLDL